MVGQIDSGSVRSLCPLIFAEELGVADHLIKDAKRGEPAIGGEFELWVPKGIAVQGQIMKPDLHEGEVIPWGPLFPMDLAFAENTTLLLGQSDFFAAFDVKLLSRDGDGIIEICECSGPPKGP